jgi:hypothetical protein
LIGLSGCSYLTAPHHTQYGDGISELCFLAIVLPFHYVDFFDEKPSQCGFSKRLRRGVSNAVFFGSRGEIKTEQACAKLEFALLQPEVSKPKEAEIDRF